MRKFVIFGALCGAVTLMGWAQPPSLTPAPAPRVQPGTPATTPALPPGLYGTMTTSMGVVKFKLHEAEAPITVKNFVELAQGRKAWKTPKGVMSRAPLYNGLTFHRVIPGFMIQGGDPEGTGSGDVGFVIEDEFSPSLMFDKPGVLGMANAGPRTGGSQFFITEAPTPHLNGRHTIFGQVIEGQEVVEQIARVPRDEEDKPRTPVKIVSITFERVGPKPANAPEGAARPTTTRTRPTYPGKKPVAK